MRTRPTLRWRPGPAADDRASSESPLIDERSFGDDVASSCRVVTERLEGATLFRLRGELDATTAIEVRVLLVAAIGERSVVMDLTEVKIIDTAGVDALRDVMRCIHEKGGLVALVRPWRTAASVLELVGTVGFAFAALSTAGALEWLGNPENRPDVRRQASNLGA